MDQLLLHGGTILTQDPAKPTTPALLAEDGRVTATGTDDEVRAMARPGAEWLDLEGRTVVPGFIDAHNHFVFSLLAELGTDCRAPRVRSVGALLYEIGNAVRDATPGEWVRGWGYNELDLDEGRHPTLAELDAVAPDNPLVVAHVSGHMCVANSAALRRAGVAPSGPQPEYGIVDRRGRRGRMTCVLHEQASEMVDVLARNAIIAREPESCVRAAHTVARRYAALGITSICDPCIPPNVEMLYGELAADPDFPLGLIGLGMGAAGMFAPPRDRVDAEDGRADGFRISGVKFFADGGEQCAVCMSKRGAVVGALRALQNAIRYRTLMGFRLFSAPRTALGGDGRVHAGIKFYDDSDLASLLERTVARGHSAAVHAMGNAAIDQVLGAVEHARRRCPDEAVFRMEHAMLPSEDAFSRMAGLGIAAVVQPRFVHDFGFPLVLTGMNRSFRALAFRDLADHGVLLAGSSDAPVCDPAVLPAIESAVTRRTERGAVLDRDQALSVEEVLAMYTANAARVLGIEARAGSLSPGRAADFVVLGDDPRAVAPDRIGQISVELTYRWGRRVHPRAPAL